MTITATTGTIRRARSVQQGWWVNSPSFTTAGAAFTENPCEWREVSYCTHYDQNGVRMRSFTFTDGSAWSTPAAGDVLSLNLDESYRAGLRH